MLLSRRYACCTWEEKCHTDVVTERRHLLLCEHVLEEGEDALARGRILLCNRISKKSYIGQDAHGVRLADSRSELGVEFGLWSSERPPKNALFHGIFWNCVLQKNGFIPKEILELCGNANGPWAVAGPGHDIRTYNHAFTFTTFDATQYNRAVLCC